MNAVRQRRYGWRNLILRRGRGRIADRFRRGCPISSTSPPGWSRCRRVPHLAAFQPAQVKRKAILLWTKVPAATTCASSQRQTCTLWGKSRAVGTENVSSGAVKAWLIRPLRNHDSVLGFGTYSCSSGRQSRPSARTGLRGKTRLPWSAWKACVTEPKHEKCWRTREVASGCEKAKAKIRIITHLGVGHLALLALTALLSECRDVQTAGKTENCRSLAWKRIFPLCLWKVM